MGNYQSHTEIENLQKLYNMNAEQLSVLRNEIRREKIKNQSLVDALKQTQTRLINKVPNNKYNDISTFLEDVSIGNVSSEIVSLTKNELSGRYESLEEKCEREFKKQQFDREQQFIAQQQNRREKYVTELNHFNKSSINALKLFKLNNNFTMDQLKSSYKKLALIYHPDRPAGNAPKFQVITKAYMALLEELKLNAPTKNFNELKQNASNFVEKQNNNPVKNAQMGQKFDSQLFNKIYTDNRLHKAEDDGYGDWITDNALEEKDIEKSELFSDKFNLNIFNSTFTDTVENSTKIVEYKTPTPLFNGVSNTQELGVENIANFTGDGYSDYKEAHTTHRLVDTDKITNKQFKNVEELEKHRANMVPLTLAELRKIKSEETLEDHLENGRQENISKHDNQETQVYNRMNKHLLESNFYQER